VDVEVLAIRLQIVDQHDAILSRLPHRDPRLVPIVRLRAKEHADDDDRQIDCDGEPIVMRDMLANAPKDHLCRPQSPIRRAALAAC
jgi:hypothetical protein